MPNAMHHLISMLLAASALIALGCRPQGDHVSTEGPLSLEEGLSDLQTSPTWILRKMTTKGEARPLAPGSKVTISFKLGKMHGNTGCNQFSMESSVTGDGAIHFSGGSVTEMACPGKLQQQQEDFLAGLNIVTRFKLRDGVLVLGDGTAENELVFAPYKAPTFPLQETKWSLTHFTESVEETDSAESVPENHPISLLIQGDKASGFGGHQAFECDVQLVGQEQVRFGEVKPLETEGQNPAASEQQSRFFDTLVKMTRFEIRENVLTLANEEQTLGLQFRGVAKQDQGQD